MESVDHGEKGLEPAADLRCRAEALVRSRARVETGGGKAPTLEDAVRAIQELTVHQVELEMQNEELRRIQGELDAARERYFDLFDQAPVGYCTLSPEGLILEANRTAMALLGVTRDTLIGQPITHFIKEEDQDLHYLNRKRFLENSRPYACDLRMVRLDRTELWAHLTVTAAQGPLTGPGRETGGTEVCRMALSDITERKQAEAHQARLAAQLQQAQKLETLGVLAGGIAHDFNNLLTVIVGNANLGSLALADVEAAAPFFTAIETAAMRAGDLTRQLLAYAGTGGFRVANVDLNIIVHEIASRLPPSIPGQVVVHYDLADRLPYVKGDAVQVFQVLMNLVTNAAEAFASGATGRISLRTRAERLDESTVGGAGWALPVLPGRYTTLEVADSGSGMNTEVVARAFEPFFTTKFTGRGLGLAAVIGILRSHGGGIRVLSEPGQGSTFKLFLPVVQEARKNPAPESLPSWRGKGRMLLVDDEGSVRSMARHMAEHLGFEVIEAGDGQEALGIFELRHGDLAVVLLDLSMPRMGGREAFLAMRQIDAGVPVVLSSGYEVEYIEDLPEGMAGFLRKPYRLAEFQGLLQRTMG
jgi:PAS domain S-box-containing protein